MISSHLGLVRAGFAPAACSPCRANLSASTQRPFAVGSTVTKRDGSPSPLCRSIHAPFWVCVDGVVVADYGNDEEAAEAHYAPLRLALRKRMGWPIEPILMDAAMHEREVA